MDNYIYVLYSRTYDRIYIGQTNDLNKRQERHNTGRVRSTKPYVPWELIHSEKFDSRAAAMKREQAASGRLWKRDDKFYDQ